MHNILSLLFQKKGITDASELSLDDKIQFEKWQAVLSEGEVTLDKVLQFCITQLGSIERSFKDIDLSEKKRDRLILLHSVYATLRDIITQPQAQKAALEKYLTDLLKNA